MTTISQSIFPEWPRNITCRQFSRRQAGNAAILMKNSEEAHLGVATKLSSTGTIELLAISTLKEVFTISVTSSQQTGTLTNDQAFKDLLAGTFATLVGFEMPRLILRLYRALELPISGIDLSTLFSKTARDPWLPKKFIAEKFSSSVDQMQVDALYTGSLEQGHRDVCLRAWVCARAAQMFTWRLNAVSKLNTNFLNKAELSCLSEIVTQFDMLDAKKPKEVPNEFTSAVLSPDGSVSLLNARYRNRVRRSNQTCVVLTNDLGDEFLGRARRVSGKTTTIRFQGEPLFGSLTSVRVVGVQESTNGEKSRDELLLQLLKGERTLRDSLFIRKMWFPSWKGISGRQAKVFTLSAENFSELNPSQYEVVSEMNSDAPIVIVHGPPGTGKTTTISAAASVWDSARSPTWVVAHSNVAVKNIAEALLRRKVDFRLIVSKEFHFEWHEHIYGKTVDKLIRADELPKEIDETKVVLGRSRIVLCTLSMIVNPALDLSGIFKLVPFKRLVVDEASQINISEFMPIFVKFKELERVCFFGDPKQLPPYGKDGACDLKTIYDVEHLQGSSKFLNIQYRMPIPLGDFISHHVYGGRLESHHKITHASCVSFVDVDNGQESKNGMSWKNIEEIKTIVHLVRDYYNHKDFCVITPYDAQRAAIERALKAEGLPWERVFNVDSFQGHESTFVLLSVVRSQGPGFLSSLNRMNVMLTRCRAGLVIVTSRSFIAEGGRRTLLGSLAQNWMARRGIEPWVDWRAVAQGKVNLPGVSGPNLKKGAPAATATSIKITAPNGTPRTALTLTSPNPTTSSKPAAPPAKKQGEAYRTSAVKYSAPPPFGFSDNQYQFLQPDHSFDDDGWQPARATSPRMPQPRPYYYPPIDIHSTSLFPSLGKIHEPWGSAMPPSPYSYVNALKSEKKVQAQASPPSPSPPSIPNNIAITPSLHAKFMYSLLRPGIPDFRQHENAFAYTKTGDMKFSMSGTQYVR